jgi:hypothetical protein
MKRTLMGAAALAFGMSAQAQDRHPGAAVAELRQVIGKWAVRTELLKPDGSVARSVNGYYDFEWVVPDRVVRGMARQPHLGGNSGILFYRRPESREIEMVSVGKDGILWRMSGKDGENVRTTTDMPMADGSRMRLRFTRSNVHQDRFESRMDYSIDAGAT